MSSDQIGQQSITLEGDPLLISALFQDQIPDLAVSEPTPIEGTGDILDSPFGGEEIRQAAEIITVIISTASAGVAFAGRVYDLIHKMKPATPVLIRSAKTGTLLASVDAGTDRKLIEKVIE